MKVLVTGSRGLIGSATVKRFLSDGYEVIGIDNNTRAALFGEEASTTINQIEHKRYEHIDGDIRDIGGLRTLFKKHFPSIVIHTAAQPSHDWSADHTLEDFHINATGTVNLLVCTRDYVPEATFVHCSTSKVYGDRPNSLPLMEEAKRFDLPRFHKYYDGITETMSVDQSKHSPFGVSKLAGDLYVQEFGRYFGVKSAIFRPGCLTGVGHRGTELHGFLSYLCKCAVYNKDYMIYGYKGKQVRDNITAEDFVEAFTHVVKNPKVAEIYNFGGGRESNCSILEAIDVIQDYLQIKMRTRYIDSARIGDHMFYIGSKKKFIEHYPDYKMKVKIAEMIMNMIDAWKFEKENNGA